MANSGIQNSYMAGMFANVIGGMFSASMSYKQGIEQEIYYNQLANAQDQQAINIQKAGAAELLNMQKQAQNLAKSQVVAVGTSGLTNYDDLVNDTMTKSQLDQMLIKQQVLNQSQNMRFDAEQSRQAGKNYRQAGKVQAIGSLINTAGSVADSWYRWKKG
jgi:hypothetical protein